MWGLPGVEFPIVVGREEMGVQGCGTGDRWRSLRPLVGVLWRERSRECVSLPELM